MTPYQNVIAFVDNLIVRYHKSDCDGWSISLNDINDDDKREFAARFLSYVTETKSSEPWEWLVESPDLAELLNKSFIEFLENPIKNHMKFLRDLNEIAIEYFSPRLEALIDERTGIVKMEYDIEQKNL